MEQIHSSIPAQHLPSIHKLSSPGRSPVAAPPPLALSLPQLTSAATKAERYSDLKECDRKGIRRAKAHVRNALKTTDDLDRISRQLNKRLRSLGRVEETKVSFNRLSVYRNAFEEIVKTSKAFSPLLKEIKDVYNEHLVSVVSSSQQEYESVGSIDLEDLSVDAAPHPPPTKSAPTGVLQLKKQLHCLEVKSRVLIQENNRLRDELIKEKEQYAQRKEEEIAYIDSLKSPPISPPEHTAVQDYATRVEGLQVQIANEREAMAKIISERKGKIPLSVCHHLEQCLREVEIESQKCQRHSEHLLQEIKKWKESLWGQLQMVGCTENFRDIWDNIIKK